MILGGIVVFMIIGLIMIGFSTGNPHIFRSIAYPIGNAFYLFLDLGKSLDKIEE